MNLQKHEVNHVCSGALCVYSDDISVVSACYHYHFYYLPVVFWYVDFYFLRPSVSYFYQMCDKRKFLPFVTVSLTQLV